MPHHPVFYASQRNEAYRFHVHRTQGVVPIDFDSAACTAYKATIPRGGIFPGVQAAPNPNLVLDNYRASSGARQHEEEAQVATRRLREKLTRARGLHFRRILGAGGNGVAALFYLGRGSRPRDFFVAKASITGHPFQINSLNQERLMTHRFEGAKHVVQLKDHPPLQRWAVRRSPRGHPSVQYPQPAGWGNVQDMIMLEYLKRGSLDKAIGAAVNSNKLFPERLCWLLFHCLVQSVIAMAWPPKEQPGFYQSGDPPVMERVQRGTWAAEIVHFDIDPRNILVGDNDANADPNHPVAPVLKLADFGTAQQLSAADRQDEEVMLRLRRRGKRDYYTPEQFTEEWDFVPMGGGPKNINPYPVVAGRFSWHTNLYHVGLIMSCLITRCFPACPPIPEFLSIKNPFYFPPPSQGPPSQAGAPGPDEGPREGPRDGGEDEGIDEEDELDNTEDFYMLGSEAFETRVNKFDNADEDAEDDDGGEIPIGDPRKERQPKRVKVISYGVYLLDESFNHISRRLRRRVAQCMCDDPRYRPRLGQLKGVIDSVIAAAAWDPVTETDEAIRRLVDEVFGSYAG